MMGPHPPSTVYRTGFTGNVGGSTAESFVQVVLALEVVPLFKNLNYLQRDVS